VSRHEEIQPQHCVLCCLVLSVTWKASDLVLSHPIYRIIAAVQSRAAEIVADMASIHSNLRHKISATDYFVLRWFSLLILTYFSRRSVQFNCSVQIVHATHPVMSVLQCKVLYNTSRAVLYCAMPSCTVLYCIVPFRTVLYYIVPYCSEMCCAMLYCTVLYCTVLY
jgi:hypothetical protein